MPTRRRRRKRQEHAITPAAIAAFRAGDWMALHAALNLKPWQYSPLDATETRQAWEDHKRHALALELRQALEAAANT